MDFVRKGISTSNPSELQTPIRGKENRRPQVDQRKTSIAEQEGLIMKQLLNEPESSKLSAAEVVAKLSKLPSGRKRNKVIRDWSSDHGRGVVAMQRSCLVKRMAHFDKGLCGRTVEAIEQPIAASASSPFGVLERLCEVRNIRCLA